MNVGLACCLPFFVECRYSMTLAANLNRRPRLFGSRVVRTGRNVFTHMLAKVYSCQIQVTRKCMHMYTVLLEIVLPRKSQPRRG